MVILEIHPPYVVNLLHILDSVYLSSHFTSMMSHPPTVNLPFRPPEGAQLTIGLLVTEGTQAAVGLSRPALLFADADGRGIARDPGPGPHTSYICPSYFASNDQHLTVNPRLDPHPSNFDLIIHSGMRPGRRMRCGCGNIFDLIRIINSRVGPGRRMRRV